MSSTSTASFPAALSPSYSRTSPSLAVTRKVCCPDLSVAMASGMYMPSTGQVLIDRLTVLAGVEALAGQPSGP